MIGELGLKSEDFAGCICFRRNIKLKKALFMRSTLLPLHLLKAIFTSNYLKVAHLLLFFYCFTSQVAGQLVPPPKQWDRTIGGTADDYLRAMVSTPDGGYLLGGYYFQGGEGG